jgi:hypothetical protein
MGVGSTPAEPPVTVVVDPDDSAGCTRFVTGLAQLPAGRAVCHPTPGETALQSLALDLLLALGKRFDAPRAERAHRRSWQLARTWLLAERIEHLFVLRANLLSSRHWQALLDLTSACNLRLWLVVHRADPHADQQLLGSTDHQRLSLAAFVHRWQQPVEHAPSKAEGIPVERFPTVPADDFTVFRAACRRLLNPASFALVDQLYCASMDQTNTWLDEQGVQWAASKSIDELPIQPFLHQLTAASVSPAETLVRLRGAQAALYLRGILLSLRWQPGTSIHLADLRIRLDRTTITRLRGLCTPRLAAALTITLITRMPPPALAALNTADITPDGSAVNRAGEWFAVPAHAQALIRALLIERACDNANPQAPLFIGRGDRRISDHAMRGMLRSVASKTAIALPTRSSWPYADPQHDWLAYFGMTVAQLELPARASPRA